MSSTTNTEYMVFSSILLVALLLMPPVLMADRWNSSNNPSRLHSDATPKKPATTKKTKPKGKNPSNDRHYKVKIDSQGRSTIRFGDGKKGRRPPRGQQGIRARYRHGKSTSAPSTTVKSKQNTIKIDKK